MQQQKLKKRQERNKEKTKKEIRTGKTIRNDKNSTIKNKEKGMKNDKKYK